jgi:hypothetical protein
LSRLVNGISSAFSQTENEVMLLLENTSGTKNSMGGSFGDIAAIIDVVIPNVLVFAWTPAIFSGPDTNLGHRKVWGTP